MLDVLCFQDILMISSLHVLCPQCDLLLCFSSHSQSKPNPKVVVCCAPGVFESRVVRYKPWSLPTTFPLSVSTHILCLQVLLMGKNDSFNLFESFLLVSDSDIVFRKKCVMKHRWINYSEVCILRGKLIKKATMNIIIL